MKKLWRRSEIGVKSGVNGVKSGVGVLKSENNENEKNLENTNVFKIFILVAGVGFVALPKI